MAATHLLSFRSGHAAATLCVCRSSALLARGESAEGLEGAREGEGLGRARKTDVYPAVFDLV